MRVWVEDKRTWATRCQIRRDRGAAEGRAPECRSGGCARARSAAFASCGLWRASGESSQASVEPGAVTHPRTERLLSASRSPRARLSARAAATTSSAAGVSRALRSRAPRSAAPRRHRGSCAVLAPVPCARSKSNEVPSHVTGRRDALVLWSLREDQEQPGVELEAVEEGSVALVLDDLIVDGRLARRRDFADGRDQVGGQGRKSLASGADVTLGCGADQQGPATG